MQEELRDLSGPERDAYFRGVQPIWGGGLSEDRFVAFQRRLADAREAGERHRLIGLFEGARLLAAMKAYDLRGSCAGRPLNILGIGAVFTPPPCAPAGTRAACWGWASRTTLPGERTPPSSSATSGPGTTSGSGSAPCGARNAWSSRPTFLAPPP